jgi:hypothetical protein
MSLTGADVCPPGVVIMETGWTGSVFIPALLVVAGSGFIITFPSEVDIEAATPVNKALPASDSFINSSAMNFKTFSGVRLFKPIPAVVSILTVLTELGVVPAN